MKFSEVVGAVVPYKGETTKPLFLHSEENRPTEIHALSSPDQLAFDLPIHVVLEEVEENGRQRNHDGEKELIYGSHIHVVVGGTRDMVEELFVLTRPQVISVRGFLEEKVTTPLDQEGFSKGLFLHDQIGRPSEIFLQDAPKKLRFPEMLHIALTDNDLEGDTGADYYGVHTRLSSKHMWVLVGGTIERVRDIIPQQTHTAPIWALDFRRYLGKAEDLAKEIESAKRDLVELERLRT